MAAIPACRQSQLQPTKSFELMCERPACEEFCIPTINSYPNAFGSRVPHLGQSCPIWGIANFFEGNGGSAYVSHR